jgi:subfamily B ATP-binding cassette protein MsbA
VSKLAVSSGDWQLYRRLLTYVWPHGWVLLASLIGAIVISATAAGFAAIMKPLVDEGFVARDPAVIERIPLLLIGLFVVRGIGNFVSQYSMTWVARRVVADIRNQMFRQIVRLPCSYYDAHPTGGLISRLTFDVEQIANAATNGLFVMVRDGMTVIALLLWMSYLNWKLTLVFAVMLPVSVVLVKVMGKRFRKASRRIQASVAEITRVVQSVTAGHRVVKTFGAEAKEGVFFAAVNEKNRRAILRRKLTASIGTPITQLLGAVAMAAVIFVALRSGEITAGGFVSYIAAVSWLLSPAQRLTQVNEVIQTSLAAAQSAFGLLDETAEPDTGSVEIGEAKGRIEFREVSFRYSAGVTDALDRVSFIIEPRQTVALVGASGSGKTTIASLLPRFYRPGSGEIRLDGTDINDIRLASLRAQIAMVGQETLLFDDTLRNNIAYGQEGGVDETRLMDAVRVAHVLEFLQQLPDGLETRVGERGLRLSGGQRQRVAIARAIYKNAPILILDEATSALDTESERLVQDAMGHLMQNRTTLVIAHRLSTVEHADRIVVLSHGKVVESGTHRELLARDGVYANLYRNQFRDTPD